MKDMKYWTCAAIASLAFAGCADDDALTTWCAEHPGLGEAAPIRTDSYYASVPFRQRHYLAWGAQELLRGFSYVETRVNDRAPDPIMDSAMPAAGTIVRMSLAPKGDPRCAASDVVVARETRDGSRAYDGLGDRCIALDRGVIAPTATWVLEHVDAGSPTGGGARGVTGLKEWRHEYRLRERATDRIHARFHDGGFSYQVTVSGNPSTTCNRGADRMRLAALVEPQRAALP